MDRPDASSEMTETAHDDLDLIHSRSVPALVAERLRDAILNAKLRPGQRLLEHKLSAQLGIGQPTLREALRELELQGFVTKKANRGTYITRLTRDDVRNLLEVRMALEALAIERAARKITAQDQAELEEILRGMEASIAPFDRAAFHKDDIQFHHKIWDLAENPYLSAALERVTFGLFAFLLLQRTPQDPVMTHVIAQHRRILEALSTHDPEAARAGFVESTLDFWRRYQMVDLLCDEQPLARL